MNLNLVLEGTAECAWVLVAGAYLCPYKESYSFAKLSQAPAPALLAECCFIITVEQSTHPPVHPVKVSKQLSTAAGKLKM